MILKIGSQGFSKLFINYYTLKKFFQEKWVVKNCWNLGYKVIIIGKFWSKIIVHLEITLLVRTCKLFLQLF